MDNHNSSTWVRILRPPSVILEACTCATATRRHTLVARTTVQCPCSSSPSSAAFFCCTAAPTTATGTVYPPSYTDPLTRSMPQPASQPASHNLALGHDILSFPTAVRARVRVDYIRRSRSFVALLQLRNEKHVSPQFHFFCAIRWRSSAARRGGRVIDFEFCFSI